MDDIGTSGALMEAGGPASIGLSRAPSFRARPGAGGGAGGGSDESKEGGGEAEAPPPSEGSKGGAEALLGSVAIRSGGTGAMARPGMLVLYTSRKGAVDSLALAGRSYVVVPNSIRGNTIGVHVLSPHTGVSSVATGVNVDHLRCVEALYGHPLTDIMVVR